MVSVEEGRRFHFVRLQYDLKKMRFREHQRRSTAGGVDGENEKVSSNGNTDTGFYTLEKKKEDNDVTQ
jgi:hypothetical protein